MRLSFSTTPRLFRLVTFSDRNGRDCSIQESSVATDERLWIGQGEHRMHLNVSDVRSLLPVLRYFVEFGELPADETEMNGGVK